MRETMAMRETEDSGDQRSMSDRLQSVSDLTLMHLLNRDGSQTVSDDAAAMFYERYMEKLMSLVERNLASKFSTRLDPEDVVQSVFGTWFRRVKEGRIAPGSRDEIWKLLSVIALNKVRNKVKFHKAKRRDVSRTDDGSEFLEAVPEPTVEDATCFLDMIGEVEKQLDDMARRTMELILDGRSVEEISKALGRTTKSVGRYKAEIGKVLERVLDADLKQHLR